LPFNEPGYGKLWQITREVQQERQPDKDKKKPAHLRRLVQEMSTQYVLRILTNQYLWDLKCSNGDQTPASRQSQQPEAKCKQRFKFSRFCHASLCNDYTISSAVCHLCELPHRPALEYASLFRNTI
jgi:hypothetical protein